MGKNFIRVDDRLIHGQIITKWAINLEIKNIVAIDDKTAANPMLKSIMTMSVPKNYKTYMCSMAESKEMIEKLDSEEGNNLIIVRFPSLLKELCRNEFRPQWINIGNVSKKEGAQYEITHNVFLSDADIEILEVLHGEGLKISFQLVPDTPLITWDKERHKYVRE
ncbi:PTS system mannose/fructose/N-acetylgalactosamine-transporter subunit IIB [Geosporobacter ferrireducens]|uniref:PTS EIIB type-4 domain-containing protein n=1 Tax=Geosporobacter ferrireducens TaxID=1424294 RepID=A0A1D8GHE5_9FIRM|nr:PTS sugar transporter subunit IIB [Geosporobacter ferrireducens]AOT70326.1 hypothetical protein Gferi_12420 [Geosporobacter ferrireducens]MTI54294.1 PTS sugar transporter subunit IIB [Geosporobacter ferrireducens]